MLISNQIIGIPEGSNRKIARYKASFSSQSFTVLVVKGQFRAAKAALRCSSRDHRPSYSCKCTLYTAESPNRLKSQGNSGWASGGSLLRNQANPIAQVGLSDLGVSSNLSFIADTWSSESCWPSQRSNSPFHRIRVCLIGGDRSSHRR
jgi:hypothetical protein